MITNASNKVVRSENYTVPFYTLSLLFMAHYSLECIEYENISPTAFLISTQQGKTTYYTMRKFCSSCVTVVWIWRSVSGAKIGGEHGTALFL